MKTRTDTKGFTLVELAVVLVIIALIIASIIGGQHLIRSSQIKSIITDANHYIQAANQFRDMYQSLPGDMPNATDQWGEVHATLATCIATAGTGTATCDGDGDGLMGDDAATFYERHRAWQHLQNAKLISGNLTGEVVGGDAANSVIGTNAPGSRLEGVGFSWYFFMDIDGLNAEYFTARSGHVLFIGKDSGDNVTLTPFLTAQEMQELDTKMDDGLPGTGSMRTFKNTSIASLQCATTDDPATAEYNLTRVGTICNPIIYTGF